MLLLLLLLPSRFDIAKFASVRFHMRIEALFLAEFLPTHLTTVWHVARVNIQVHLERRFLTEAAVADFALKKRALRYENIYVSTKSITGYI